MADSGGLQGMPTTEQYYSFLVVPRDGLGDGPEHLYSGEYVACEGHVLAQLPPEPAVLVTPKQSDTIIESSVHFTWTTGTGASQYQLYVGSSPGAFDYAKVMAGTLQSATVSGLPTDGRRIYVRLWSLQPWDWLYSDSVFDTTDAAGAAVLSSPAQGMAITESAVAFAWTPGNASQYWLYLGSAPGANDYGRFAGDARLNITTSDLPLNGQTIYARVWSLLPSGWVATDAAFEATNPAGAAVLNYPAEGQTLTGASALCAWTGAADASKYLLYLGSAPGMNDLGIYDGGNNLSVETADLPVDGRTIYARVWSLRPGGWVATDSSFVAADAAASGASVLAWPAEGTALSETSVAFTLTRGGATSGGPPAPGEYWLYLGSSAGANDYGAYHCTYSCIYGTRTRTLTATSLPTDGRTIYTRVWTYLNGQWLATDSAFTTSNSGGAAVLNRPAQGEVLAGNTVTFTWNAGIGASQYQLYVGSTPGANDYGIYGRDTNLSAAVSGLPTDGRRVYARIWTLLPGGWTATDYSFLSGPS